MTAPYRLYGAELSPYSLKVRAFLRYKGLAHDWVARTQAGAEEFARYARLPLLPVLVGADESVLQESTAVLERLEALHPEPPATPDDPSLAFLAALIEDYADEWLHRALFHHRWSRPEDAAAAAAQVVEEMLAGHEGEAPDRDALAAQVRERMTGRLSFVGSNAESAALIETSFARALALLEAHLALRPYLFGGRPTAADFALAGQTQAMLRDHTAGALIRETAPAVARHAARMVQPTIEGPEERLDALRPTLAPFLEEEVAGRYLAWAEANAEALRDGADGFEITLMGQLCRQVPQRYAARAFGEVRRKRALAAEDPALAALLGDAGCDRHLAPPTAPGLDEPEAAEDEASAPPAPEVEAEAEPAARAPRRRPRRSRAAAAAAPDPTAPDPTAPDPTTDGAPEEEADAQPVAALDMPPLADDLEER